MQTVTELIRVTGVSEYSVYSGQQRYSFNKGVNSSMFTKGNTYSVNVKVGKNGGKYIDSVSNDLGVLAGDVTPAATSSNAGALNPNINKGSNFKSFSAKKDDNMTKEEWAAKDVRISRSGVIQAAVQAVATHSKDVNDLEVKAIALAEAMLAFVNQSSKEVVS